MGEFSRIHQTDLTDRQLMDFWMLAQASGRDRAWSIEVPPLSPGDFVGKVRQDGRHSWFITFRDVPCGLFTLDIADSKSRSAKAHFLCLPCGARRTATKGVTVIRGMGLFALGQALWETTPAGTYRLNTILGATPACNRIALKYLHILGAEFVAAVPDMFWAHDEAVNVGGVITTFTRDRVPEWCAKL